MNWIHVELFCYTREQKSDIYPEEKVCDYFFRLQLRLQFSLCFFTTDIFPLGELCLFTTRCLQSQHVYSLSLGLLLFNYSSHLADGDSVCFHQRLGSFSCPCFASLQRQTAASDLKTTRWFSIHTAEWSRIWNLKLSPNTFFVAPNDSGSLIRVMQYKPFTFNYDCVISIAVSVCLLLHVVCVILLTSKVFPSGFPGSRRSRPACRTPGPGSPACVRDRQVNRWHRNTVFLFP